MKNSYLESKLLREYLFIFSVSLLFFSLTFDSASSEFSILDLVLIILAILIACFCQLKISYVFKKHYIQGLMLSVFLLLNVVSLNLILNNDFVQSGILLVVLYSSIILFVLYTLINIINDFKLGAIYISLIAISASLYFIFSPIFESQYNQESAHDGMTSSKKIKMVAFKEKPNVYIVSFDALIPQHIYMKQFKASSPTKYHEILGERLYSFKNFFADDVPTKKSLSSLMLLDKEHYLSLDESIRYQVFNGVVKSPLFEIFKYNGYITNTLFQNGYFGRRKGPYVDNYFVSDKWTGACQFIPKEKLIYAFFGYCAMYRSQIFHKLHRYFDGFDDDYDPMNYLLEKMKVGVGSPDARVFIAYIYSPGHTKLNYKTDSLSDFEEYKKYYDENSSRAADYVKRLLDFIDNYDPSAIVYIFGDHGPYMTRSIEFNDDNEYFVQDRFAVYGGVYPKDRCHDSLSLSNQEEYTTVIQGMYLIIRCLTGGEEVFLGTTKFNIHDYGKTERERRYETYLYEE